MRFDCLLSAELARAYKPAPEAYWTAARLLGVAPAELMLAAAHAWDLEGAREAGLRTAFVARPLEYGPDSAPPAAPGADESVADLLSSRGAWQVDARECTSLNPGRPDEHRRMSG